MNMFSLSVLKVVPIIGAAVVFYVIVNCIYKVTFHPLAKYPGPFLAKFTDLYAAYHAWKGDIHIDMWKCHENHGKFVRYAPNILLTNTAVGTKDIYSSGKNFVKSQHYEAMVHKALNTLTIRDRKEHGRRRRVISQGVSDSALRNYEPTMLTLVSTFCDRLVHKYEDGGNYPSDEWQPARDMSKWCGYLAFDIMADLIFGRVYDLLTKDTYRYVLDAIEASNVRVSVLIHAPSMKNFRLDKFLFPKAIYGRNMFVRFVGKLLRDSAKVTPSTKKSFFNILATAKDPVTGSGLTREEIIAESTTLVVAGVDTVATAIAAVFFYLSRNANSYERAAREVRDTFASVEEIRMGAKLNSCIFLRACIDESMRMTPSVGSSLHREVLQGGAIVDGEFIPEGYDVGTSIYSIHHNEAYFPDSFKFRPERWIVGEGDTTKESLDLALGAYLPFSTGARGCIGKGMALSELMLTMATVLWRLDFKISDHDTSGGSHESKEFGRNRPEEFQLKDHVTGSNSGLLLHFRERRI